MFRYLFSLTLYLVMLLLSVFVAPLLPVLAVVRDGPADNGNATEVGPRLPAWLFWFDTSTDNNLWGDSGWRTKHCPDHWDSYWGMVLWLWRNPIAGFCWSILAAKISRNDCFTLKDSGCGISLDKGRGAEGWFFIRSSNGVFHFRFVKSIFGVQLAFEAGWVLDAYINDPEAISKHPLAIFSFEPHIARIKAS